MPTNHFNIQVLTIEKVLDFRNKFGYNRAEYKKENRFLSALSKYAKDLMIILLLVASSIYFISGKTIDGIFLASAICYGFTHFLVQDSRSRNALDYPKPFNLKFSGRIFQLLLFM